MNIVYVKFLLKLFPIFMFNSLFTIIYKIEKPSLIRSLEIVIFIIFIKLQAQKPESWGPWGGRISQVFVKLYCLI